MLAPGPICGPLLILSPSLRCWGPPILQGLCYHRAHLWVSSDSVPPLFKFGDPPPEEARVMLPPGPFVGHF